jgi:hypothetical protein
MKELRLLLALVALATVASCAQIMALTDSAADKAGKAIAEYCKLPAETRAQFRVKVAERAAPHSATINCAPGL